MRPAPAHEAWPCRHINPFQAKRYVALNGGRDLDGLRCRTYYYYLVDSARGRASHVSCLSSTWAAP
jgi:hypothetical protein